MGFIGDAVVLGQKPRDNGCICAWALIPIIGGPLFVIAASAWGIAQVVT